VAPTSCAMCCSDAQPPPSTLSFLGINGEGRVWCFDGSVCWDQFLINWELGFEIDHHKCVFLSPLR
jgi:hypothetical protein